MEAEAVTAGAVVVRVVIWGFAAGLVAGAVIAALRRPKRNRYTRSSRVAHDPRDSMARFRGNIN